MGVKVKDGFRKECFRCGAPTHLANKCPFSNLDCFKCGKKGHKANKCFSGSKLGSRILKRNDRDGGENKEVRFSKIDKVSVLDAEDKEIEELNFLSIHRMSRNEIEDEDPVMVGLCMNN